MKSTAFFRLAFFATAIVIAPWCAAQTTEMATTMTVGGLTPTARADKLDGLVRLTADQRAKAIDIFTRQDAAMERATSTQRPPLFRIFEAAQAELRSILTSDQLKIYDRTPQSEGGGFNYVEPQFRVKQLDKEVGLTADQKKVALAVYTEEYDALRALPFDQRAGAGTKFNRAATDQIRAILTPAQIDKRDSTEAASNARAEEEITAIEKAVRDSAGIRTRVGAKVGEILDLQRQGRSVRNPKGNRLGEARFKVSSESSSEFITVYWERVPATAPLKVTKITDAHNQVISP